MIVKNEAENIRTCLDSIKSLVDEIIVVDTGSDDNTVSIAEEAGAKVLHKKWDDHFSNARNYSLSEANTKWILYMDADEVFAGSFQKIRADLENTDKEAFFMDIESVTGEKPYEKVVHPSIRIFRNNQDYCFTGVIHEDILPSILKKHTSMSVIGKTQGKLLHRGYSPAQARVEKAYRNRRILEKSLRECPDDPYLQYHLGITYEQLSLDNQAIEHVKQSLERTDTNQSYRPTLVKDLAKLYMKGGQYDSAIDLLKREINNYQDYPDLHYYLGYGFRQKKEMDKAIRVLEKATKTTPSRPYAMETGKGTYLSWTLMGDIALEWNACNDALQFYIKALQHCPYHYEALYGIADLLIASGRQCSDIKKELTHILTPSLRMESPLRQLCLQEVANVLFATGCDKEFLDFCKDIDGNPEKEIFSLLHLNHLHEASERLDSLQKPVSATLLQAIIVTFNEHSYPYPEKMYEEIKNNPDAHFYNEIIQMLLNGEQKNSNPPLSFLVFAKQFLHQSILFQAPNVRNKLISLHPVFQLFAAKTSYYEGYVKEASETFHSLLDENKLDLEGTFLLGEYYFHQKDWERASILFEKIVDAKENYESARIGASLCYNQQSKSLLIDSIKELPDYPLFTAYLKKVELAIQLSSKHGWQTNWRGRQRRVRLQNEQHIAVHDR